MVSSEIYLSILKDRIIFKTHLHKKITLFFHINGLLKTYTLCAVDQKVKC